MCKKYPTAVDRDEYKYGLCALGNRQLGRGDYNQGQNQCPITKQNILRLPKQTA